MSREAKVKIEWAFSLSISTSFSKAECFCVKTYIRTMYAFHPTISLTTRYDTQQHESYYGR